MRTKMERLITSLHKELEYEMQFDYYAKTRNILLLNLEHKINIIVGIKANKSSRVSGTKSLSTYKTETKAIPILYNMIIQQAVLSVVVLYSLIPDLTKYYKKLTYNMSFNSYRKIRNLLAEMLKLSFSGIKSDEQSEIYHANADDDLIAEFGIKVIPEEYKGESPLYSNLSNLEDHVIATDLLRLVFPDKKVKFVRFILDRVFDGCCKSNLCREYMGKLEGNPVGFLIDLTGDEGLIQYKKYTFIKAWGSLLYDGLSINSNVFDGFNGTIPWENNMQILITEDSKSEEELECKITMLPLNDNYSAAQYEAKSLVVSKVDPNIVKYKGQTELLQAFSNPVVRLQNPIKKDEYINDLIYLLSYEFVAQKTNTSVANLKLIKAVKEKLENTDPFNAKSFNI